MRSVGAFFDRLERNSLYAILFTILLVGSLNFYKYHRLYNELTDKYKVDPIAEQQLTPFYQYHFSDFKENYVDIYYLDAWAPVGYKFILKNLSPYFHPISIINAIIALEYMVSLIFVYLASKKFFGVMGAAASCMFLLTNYMVTLQDGMPHSYVIPLTAITLYALLTDKLWLGLLSAILAFCFYPSAGFFIVVTFGLKEYLVKPYLAGNRYGFRQSAANILSRKTLYFIITGLIAIAIAFSMISSSKEYGARINAHEQQEFPEAYKYGRYFVGNDIPPTGNVFVEYFNWTQFFFMLNFLTKMIPEEFMILYVISAVLYAIKLVALILTVRYCFKNFRSNLPNTHSITLISYLGAMTICFFLSEIFFPFFFMPARYMQLLLPAIMVYYTFPGLLILFRVYFNKLSEQNIKLLGLVFAVIFNLVNGAYVDKNITTNESREEYKGLYDFVSSLPETSVIAGWPSGRIKSAEEQLAEQQIKKKDRKFIPLSPIEGLEVITARRAYYNFEVHQAIHKNFMLHMREVADKFFDAYFATSIDELKKFRDETGTGYMIVDSYQFLEPTDPNYAKPEYFVPFDIYVNAKLENVDKKKFILPKLEKDAVYHDDRYYIIDLKKL